MVARSETHTAAPWRGHGAAACTTSTQLLARVLLLVAARDRLALALGVPTSDAPGVSASVVRFAAVNAHMPGLRTHARTPRRRPDPVPESWLHTPVEPRFRWGDL